LILKEIQH